MVDSLARRSVKSEVDHLGKVAWNEQADLSGGQTVVAHLALVGQEGDDVSRGRSRRCGDVVDDLVLQPLQAGLFLGTFSSHGVLMLE